MKIRKLHLKNIGVFDDEEIDFQECPAKDKAEIHILTGENGTGKTTILQALASIFDNPGVESIEGPNAEIVLDSDYQLSNNFRKKYRRYGEFWATFSNGKRAKLQGKGDLIDYINYIEVYLYSKLISSKNPQVSDKLNFAVFAFSGYRQVEDERVQANYLPPNFNPLSQSLEFIKDYRKEGEITINQLLTNYLNDLASATFDGSVEEAKKYELVIRAIEEFIQDVTEYEVKFVYKRQPRELKLKMYGEELDFDVLPDGLRSLISWIADLLGRVDLLKWQDDLPITDKKLILLLDEIEVHLHPAWQRKVLPVVQKLFKNAQIFVSTHSPFVVNSVDDAWVYKLKVDEYGKAHCEEPILSEDGISYQTVLSEIFGIDQEFGGKTQDDLDRFYKIIRNGKVINEKELTELAKSLAEQSEELNSIVQIEIRQLNRKRGTNYSV